MAIGFIAYSAFILTRNVLGNRLSYGLAIFASVITLIIRNAYVFPIILACAILFSYFFLKVPEEKKPEDFIKTNWKKIIPLILVFLFFALLGAIINRTSVFSLPVRLFENFYRNGIFIFGGGQVLAPLLYTEFVEMKHYLTTPEFMSGYALQQIIPGPLFSFTSFIGAMSVKGAGISAQLIGSLAALIGINLPGLLFILTIFPFWDKLKTKKSIIDLINKINNRTNNVYNMMYQQKNKKLGEYSTLKVYNGIEEKLIGAARAGSTLFLAPALNCNDIVHVPSGLQVVAVETLREAVTALESKDLESLPACG